MATRDATYRPYVVVLSLALLFAGLVLDLATTQGLVVAILYDIPIALSGLARSRRLTVAVTLLAAVNNLLAGYANALATGALDSLALLNRGLSLLSFLLIAALTLALHNASAEVSRMTREEERARLEHDLRHFSAALSGPLSAPELLQDAAERLRRLLGAEAVVISGLSQHRFAPPRYAAPADTPLAGEGELASWALDALPTRPNPTLTVRTDRGPVTVGLLRQGEGRDLAVMVSRSSRDEASRLLAEALVNLTPLLARAEAAERLKEERGG